jgi:hypothetical protein
MPLLELWLHMSILDFPSSVSDPNSGGPSSGDGRKSRRDAIIGVVSRFLNPRFHLAYRKFSTLTVTVTIMRARPPKCAKFCCRLFGLGSRPSCMKLHVSLARA